MRIDSRLIKHFILHGWKTFMDGSSALKLIVVDINILPFLLFKEIHLTKMYFIKISKEIQLGGWFHKVGHEAILRYVPNFWEAFLVV